MSEPDLAVEPSHRTRRGPGRPRSLKSTRAILDATRSLLAEQGFSAMSMDEVARRARVGKDTLYRRWPSKAALVIDAIEPLAAGQVSLPDTGNLRTDLLHYLTDVIELLTTTDFGRIIADLVGEASRNPAIAQAFQGFWASESRAGRRLLERAATRGELRPGIDPELAVDLVLGPVFYRLILSGSALDRRHVEELVEFLLRALAEDG